MKKEPKIYTLSEKLPKINTDVFIFSRKLKTVYSGSLKIYVKGKKMQDCDLKEGDIYWENYNISNKNKTWGEVESFPYWTSMDNLLEIVKMSVKLEETEELNRLDILDL